VIESSSDCKDVAYLEAATANLNQQTFQVHSGGTTLRFLALRLSRYPGQHRIQMSKQLYERPHEDLNLVLQQLGVNFAWGINELRISGASWQLEKAIEVNVNKSSQVLSALLLNSWLLESDIDIYFNGPMISESYFKMTLEILNFLGMQWENLDGGLRIKAKQQISRFSASSEIDMSSAFTLAALATIDTGHIIEPFVYPSIQGDADFLAIFEEMGIPFALSDWKLTIYPVNQLRPIQCDLKNTPDLFPVLAMLCSMAEGSSTLDGAKHLAYKESNRIESMAYLFDSIGIKYDKLADGMRIHGNATYLQKEFISIDCQNDHRIAFAAALAKLRGHNIKITGKECVEKSFAGFWQQFNGDFCEMDLYP